MAHLFGKPHFALHRHGLKAGVAMVGLCCVAQPVWAQEDMAVGQGVIQPTQPDAMPGDLVVTAQRLRERIIDVPLSVSAFTAQQLDDQKIEGGSELLRAIPNISFSKDNFAGYNFVIRGIGTKAMSVTADPAVAISFNFTPLMRNRLFEQEYFDVERLEVLRGPQGTLYGRNATAGVVNMLPARPKLGVWDAEIQGETGNYSSTRLRGMVNIPIGETLAIRGAAAWTKRDGYDFNSYTNRRVNGRNLYSTRLSALWEPSSDVRFHLIWEHFNENDNRSRTGKQLCTRGEAPKTIDFKDENGVNQSAPVFTLWTQSSLTPGCQNKSLFTDEAFGVPNGSGFPINTALLFAFPGKSRPGKDSYLTNLWIDPFSTPTNRQSADLREISTMYDPVFRAKNDIFQLNAEFNLAPALHLTLQSLYTQDSYYGSQDFFRFTSKPFFRPRSYYASIRPEWDPYFGPDQNGKGIFIDPQLGALDHPVAVDISRADSRQWSQEIRLNSSSDGPFNFNLGANYLRFKTHEEYLVFSNLFTAAAVSQSGLCDSEGVGCPYIDPNPIGKINGDGHNYYRSISVMDLRSIGLFGEAYWRPSDAVKVTLGLRYINDHKRITPYASQLLTATKSWDGGYVDRGYPAEADVDMRWQRVTGRLSVDWKPDLGFTDDTLVYATLARGFKSGGGNPRGQAIRPCDKDGMPVPPAEVCGNYTQLPADFAPEQLNTLEIGIKNSFNGGRFTFNLSAFLNDYKDYQISQLIDRAIRTENFDAKTYGLEMEAAWIPSRHFKLGATLGYLRSRIADGARSIDVMNRTQGNPDWMVVRPWAGSPNTCIAPKALVGALSLDQDTPYRKRPREAQTGNVSIKRFCETSTLLGPGSGFTGEWTSFTYDPLAPYDPSKPSVYYGPNPSNYGAPNQGRGFYADLSGHELPNAPRLTFNIGAEYTFFVDDWRLALRGDYYRQSRSYARVYNTDYDRLRGWGNANAAITLTAPDTALTFQLYLKNIFNSTPITDAFTGPDEIGNFTNVFTLDPRIIGFSAKARF